MRWGHGDYNIAVPSRYFLSSLVLVALLLVPTLTPQGQAVVKSSFFLLQLLPDTPDLRWLTPPLVRERVAVPFNDGQIPVQVVRPADGTHTGVVFVPGLELDMDDPVIGRALDALSGLGLAVMVPPAGSIALAREHPGQAAEELLTGEADPVGLLVASFRHLQGMDYIKDGRVGFMGFSVGASLAAIAAADPRINDTVAFLHWFGGFNSAFDASAALVTGRVWVDGRPEPWSPNQWAVDRVERALWVTNPDTAVVPEGLGSALERLSPSAYAGRLRAPTFVLHDVGDRFIHFGESQRFWQMLPGAVRAGYTEVALFEHVMLGRGGSPGEMAKLIGHLSSVLLLVL